MSLSDLITRQPKSSLSHSDHLVHRLAIAISTKGEATQAVEQARARLDEAFGAEQTARKEVEKAHLAIEEHAERIAQPAPAVDEDRVNQIAREGENVNRADQFNMDEHVKLVADANRYRWLRDRECIEDVDSDLLVLRGETYFIGAELDAEIDTALRLQRLESQEDEPCEQ